MRRYVNYLLARLQGILKTPFSYGYPFIAHIEPANFCNLSCPFCGDHNRAFERKHSLITVEKFQRIFDQIGDHLLQLNLFWYGEPLLNKDLPEMIKIAKKKSLRVALSTNMTILTESMADGLVTSGLDLMILSIDGATQETYQKYRVGGDYEKVVKNIELLKRKKIAHVSDSPRLEWRFLVFKHNEHEVEAAREFAKQLGVEFGTLHAYVPPESTAEWSVDHKENGDGLQGQASSNPARSRQSILRKGVCAWPWGGIQISADGGAHPCSVRPMESTTGNLLAEPFKTVWRGASYRKLRRTLRDYMLRVPASKDGEENVCSKCEHKQNAPGGELMTINIDPIKGYYLDEITKFDYQIIDLNQVSAVPGGKNRRFSLNVTRGRISSSSYWFDPFKLQVGIGLFDQSMTMISNDARIPISRVLKQGDSFEFDVYCPSRLDLYALKFDLVKDDKFWFHELGALPHFIRIDS